MCLPSPLVLLLDRLVLEVLTIIRLLKLAQVLPLGLHALLIITPVFPFLFSARLTVNRSDSVV